MGVTRFVSKIPEDLFYRARKEISSIDWNNLPLFDTRSETKIFSTSKAVHLRIHDNRTGKKLNVYEISEIVECINTPIIERFPDVIKLVEWVENEVGSTARGRIMIVNLQSKGDVALHVDPGKYFASHFRFHVPIVTHPDVVFISDENDREHMPEGTLNQLLNRKKHGVMNGSSEDRIHIIIDLATDQERFNY